MPRRWRGPLVIEGEQTGDGRVIVEGALTWAPLPLPLAWLRDGDQHISLTEVAPQVGIIESIRRDASGELIGEGIIDDDNPDGAELVRRLDAGTAALGNRVGVSIDPDNWQVQIVDTSDDDDGDIVIVASGSASDRSGHVTWVTMRQAGLSLVAAAGDPDPGEDGVMWEMAADEILERYTQMRIRGATCCAVAAFSGATIELVDDEAEDQDDDEAEPEPEAALAASAAVAAKPRAEWLSLPEPQAGMTGMVDVYGMPVEELLVDQPGGRLGVPLTIIDDGRVFAHVATWGQCHTGSPGVCRTAPPSASGYANFHVGALHVEGERLAVGTLTVGCDHAPVELDAAGARDHYANSGLGWSNARAIDGTLGPWVSGVLRPDVTREQVYVLRTLALSGDWRPMGAQLELVNILAVNVPGFPIVREALTASGLVPAAPLPRTHLEDGEQTALVASGVVRRCAECQRRAIRDAEMALAGRARPARRLASPRQLVARVERLERTLETIEPLVADALRARLVTELADALGDNGASAEVRHLSIRRRAAPSRSTISA